MRLLEFVSDRFAVHVFTIAFLYLNKPVFFITFPAAAPPDALPESFHHICIATPQSYVSLPMDFRSTSDAPPSYQGRSSSTVGTRGIES